MKFEELVGAFEADGKDVGASHQIGAELDNSRAFDVHRWADFPELKELAQRLAREFAIRVSSAEK